MKVEANREFSYAEKMQKYILDKIDDKEVEKACRRQFAVTIGKFLEPYLPINITAEKASLEIYVISKEQAKEIVREAQIIASLMEGIGGEIADATVKKIVDILNGTDLGKKDETFEGNNN